MEYNKVCQGCKTCKGKPSKTREATLKDQKGEPEFQIVICEHEKNGDECWDTIWQRKINGTSDVNPVEEIDPQAELKEYQKTVKKAKKPKKKEIVVGQDLFGQDVVKKYELRDEFVEPPFTVLDTKSGTWQKRKKGWLKLGIKSEVGRDAKTYNMSDWLEKNPDNGPMKMNDTSIFDPVLCELMYKWFCTAGGKILDPFSGGSVRGIVANKLGFKYTGIDIRQEQIDSNRAQAETIEELDELPTWLVGDSNKVLDNDLGEFDFVFSCPPYADLEVYSNKKDDISNMSYEDFLVIYRMIIEKSVQKLKKGMYACFVVGDVRDKNGYYYNFVSDTIQAFLDAGTKLYNEAILLNSIASAALRAGGNMKYQKLVKVHQNILVFKKV